MATETYTLVIDENDDRSGITADVYNESGTIEESTFVAYEDYGLTISRTAEGPDERRREVTADAMGLELDVERDDAGFHFRLLGDGSDELLTERVGDDEWGLAED